MTSYFFYTKLVLYRHRYFITRKSCSDQRNIDFHTIKTLTGETQMIKLEQTGRVITAALLVFLVQTVTAAVLEEVVVTAQKREQDIQDVGIAITAFSGEQIQALGFSESIDVARFTPGVYVSATSGGQNSQFTIRGVSQNDFLDAVEAPVAVYIDEGYVATQNGQQFALFDIERVEVAKGPQGTLFGRNATGGLVHYLSRKPTEEFEGYGDVTYGSYDQFRFEGAVSGPLGESVSARVSGYFNRHDEIMDNEFPDQALGIAPAIAGGGQDFYNDDTWGLRAHLQFNPNEDAEILLTGFATETEFGVSPYQNMATIAELDAQRRVINSYIVSSSETRASIGPGGVDAGLDLDGNGVPETFGRAPGADVFGYQDRDGEDFDTSSDFAFDDINSLKTYGGNGKISWDINSSITLTSITDYKKFEKFNILDVDGSATDWFQFVSSMDAESISQEVRLNGETERMRWVLGLYYLNIDNDTDTGFLFNQGSVTYLGIFDDINEVRLDTESFSGFGQLEYDLVSELTLIAGLRIVQEDKDYTLDQTAYINTNDLTIDKEIVAFPIAPTFITDTSDTLWTGKVQLDWRPNENLLVYAGVNRGVKAGSFNAPITFFSGTPFNLLPYDEEILLAYEAGFKSTLFNGTTRFNGSFYYYDYKDYQASVFAGINQVIQNVDANIKGVEFELITTPAAGWDLMFSVGYVDAEVEDLAVAPGITRDVRPTFVPEVTLAGLVRYEIPDVVMGGRVALQGDFNYASDFFHNARNFDAQEFDGYWLGNVRVNWTSADNAWQGEFFINNVGDERVPLVGFDLSVNCGCTINAYGKPRWFGGSIRYSWQ